MKRILALCLFVAFAGSASIADARSGSKLAPADEYFGSLKLSILGIRNTIRDVGANLEVDMSRWEHLSNKAEFAEDALHDWQRKYPGDTWLPKTIFALERLYAKIDNEEGHRRRVAATIWIVHDFPGTCYARVGREELETGHTLQANCE